VQSLDQALAAAALEAGASALAAAAERAQVAEEEAAFASFMRQFLASATGKRAELTAAADAAADRAAALARYLGEGGAAAAAPDARDLLETVWSFATAFDGAAAALARRMAGSK
jgi:hypothetical protein